MNLFCVLTGVRPDHKPFQLQTGIYLSWPEQNMFYIVRKGLVKACILIICILSLAACSVSKQISRQATAILLKDSAISSGHIGVSIYDPLKNEYLYNHDAAKYFVPASNTKLFSLYAGLKYLGDSLPALRYELGNDSSVRIQATGDPTFLHPGYANQPVFNFLNRFKKVTFTNPVFTDNFMGRGWAWDDYKESYMVQRSNLPIYGNLVKITRSGDALTINPPRQKYLIPPHTDLQNGFDVSKKWDDNLVTITSGTNQYLYIPFSPNLPDIISMMQDTLHMPVFADTGTTVRFERILYSQPVDSLYQPMMHRSDNFFAEQTLLMASNELLGLMDDRKIIDTLLNSLLRDIPQKPKWVDGSGLSRYNLFTPQSFVYLLNKLKNEFGLERLRHILPTGGEGTLSSHYKNEAGFIFAKTGTLSNHCALSGYLITKKNRLLIFSVLVNNYQTGAIPIRKAIENFIIGLREKY